MHPDEITGRLARLADQAEKIMDARTLEEARLEIAAAKLRDPRAAREKIAAARDEIAAERESAERKLRAHETAAIPALDILEAVARARG